MESRFSTYSAAVDALDAALALERQPVGVKIFRSSDEFASFDAPEPRVAAYYCALTKLAARGYRFKLAPSHFKCGASAIALGIEQADDPAARADSYVACDLYRDRDVAAGALGGSPQLAPGVVGVVVAPLASFTAAEAPDVVIIVASAYTAMRLVQGYSFHHPDGASARMRGMHGICGESTAAPLLANELTMSLLCSGTRFIAKWRDDEVAISLPAAQFAELVDGVLATLASCEPDAKKVVLEAAAGERLAECGVEIGYGAGYFYDV